MIHVTKRTRANDFAAEQAAQLQTWSEQKICSWLLGGFSSGWFDPIKMLAEPSEALQIHNIFCAAPPHAQARIKSATARAILEWTSQSHEFSVLAELARVAAHTRASETVPHLAQHLKAPALRSPHSDEAREARDFLVAVLCGFAPLEQARPFLLGLYEDADFYEYGATLFLSLCSYDLDRFVDHVPQFLRILDSQQEFALDMVLDSFAELVPRPVFDSKLPWLLVHAEPFVRLVSKHTGLVDPPPTTTLLPPSSDMPLAEDPQRRLFRTQHDDVLAVPLENVIFTSLKQLQQRFESEF